MNDRQLRESFRKYDFPAYLFVLFDIVFGCVSGLLWTTWTKALLRMLGCPYGGNLRVDGHVIIRVARRGAIRIGDRVTIKSHTGSNLVLAIAANRRPM